MERAKASCSFLTLVVFVVTGSVGYSGSPHELTRHRWVNIPMTHSENGRNIMKACRHITRGRSQHVMHISDGTLCTEAPVLSKGSCFHGLCVGSYREMSAEELAENTTKAEYHEVQPVKCSEYKRSVTAARSLVDCAFRCIEKEAVYIVQERKWLPCETKPGDQGQCIDGTCWTALPLMWIPRNTDHINTPQTVNQDATTTTSATARPSVSTEKQIREIEVDKRRETAEPKRPYLVITHIAEKLASASRPFVDATRYRRANLVRVLQRYS